MDPTPTLIFSPSFPPSRSRRLGLSFVLRDVDCVRDSIILCQPSSVFAPGPRRLSDCTMRSASWLAAGLFGALNLVRAVNAEDLFEAHSLSTCSSDDVVSINRFDVTYTRSDNNIDLGFTGSFTGSTSTNVLIDIDVLIYGYNAISLTINPCASPKISFLCPMESASLNIQSTSLSLDSDALSGLPS